MTLMLDSTSPGSIPADTPVVAGYIDGRYEWTQAEWNRFSGTHVTITVQGRAGATVADVEQGDLTAAGGAGWAMREIQAGRRPTLYASKSMWSELVVALAAVHISPLEVDWWCADPTNVPHLENGSVATQWMWGAPGTYDTSMTDGIWPGRLPPVTDKPPFVAIINRPGSNNPQQYWGVAADGGVFSFPDNDCPFFGSLGGKPISAPIVDAAAMEDGQGYRLIGSDGAIYDFGSAAYEGGGN